MTSSQSDGSVTEADLRLPLMRRALPWVWLLLAVAGVVLRVDAALVIGGIVMSQLTRMENRSYRLALAFSIQSDAIARAVKARRSQ